jgi:hypothetical protein
MSLVGHVALDEFAGIPPHPQTLDITTIPPPTLFPPTATFFQPRSAPPPAPMLTHANAILSNSMNTPSQQPQTAYISLIVMASTLTRRRLNSVTSAKRSRNWTSTYLQRQNTTLTRISSSSARPFRTLHTGPSLTIAYRCQPAQ